MSVVAVGAGIILAGCGTSGGSVEGVAAGPVVSGKGCGETLMVDYVPSEDYGSETPEEALRKYAVYYRGRAGESDPSQALTHRAWARAFESANVQDPASGGSDGTVQATSRASGKEMASFVVKRSDDGPPRWAVTDGWVLLPSDACAPVDALYAEEEQRQQEAR